MGAVVAIERYRVEHDITDRRTVIGPEPDESGQTLDWYRVNDSIIDALDAIAPSAPAITRHVPAIEGPSLSIEI